ncbi:MAG TPA: transcription termination factor Rho [Acidimicrobiales bacterium]|nr:transcription termination factor Rho [Acidimicrobiales bacterium]
MSAEQLERSILERKASDELRAIATAMSLDPAPRTKKADLVTQILRAAGVEVEGPAANGHGQAATSGEPSGDAAPAPAPAAPAEADGAAGSNGNGAPRRSRSRSAKPVSHAAQVVMQEGAGDGVASPGNGHANGERAEADRSSARSEDGVPAGAGGDVEPPADQGATTADRSSSGAVEAPSAGDARGAVAVASAIEAPERSQAGNGSSNATALRPEQHGPSQHGNQQPNQSQNQQRQQFQAAQAEAGNRRGRRRRGRDRGEREPQGGGAETPYTGELVPVKGLLDLRDEGYGFLRTAGYLPSQKDVYVSVSQARRFGLRRGDAVEGACRPAGPSEKYPALLRIDTISGMTPDEAMRRRRFEDLTPLFPDERLRLELRDDPANMTARIVDLISPIGKGQRGLIVSPPKAGKTTVLKQIAHSIEANNPDVHLMVLLVEERPEEVTDMRRSVKGEVIASTFDRPSEEHTAVSELAIERAKRLVELGRDVVIILDGITRLARAYNLAQPATGRIMSGGVDSGALYPPRKFFGAARNIEEGGSLTILATALVETGSKMDEVIFEEFKGTGNMELRLDRKLAERRIYPAIDVNASSTRHEELLFDRNQLQQVWKLRRVLNALSSEGNPGAGLELLMDRIKSTRSNDEFLAEIAKAPNPTN